MPVPSFPSGPIDPFSDPTLSDYAKAQLEEQERNAASQQALGGAHLPPAGAPPGVALPAAPGGAPTPGVDPTTAAIAASNASPQPFQSIAPGGGSVADIKTTPVPQTVEQKAAAAVAPPPPTTPQQAAKDALMAKGIPGGATANVKLPYGQQRDERLGALKDLGEAEQAANRAQQVANINRADLLDQQRDQAEQRMVAREAKRVEREQIVDDQMRQLDSDIQAVKNTSYNSGRFFANPGGMIMAIGAALGGGAAARVTGRNEGQAALEAALSRDFNEWKANADQKQSAVREKSNLVTQMRQQYADRNQADQAAEIIHRDMATSALEAQALRSKVPEIQAQGLKIAAEMRDKTAQKKEEYNATVQKAAQDALERRQKLADEQRKYELEVFKANTERQKAVGETGKEARAGASKIAERLNQANVPAAGAAGKRADTALGDLGPMSMNPIANRLYRHAPLLYNLVFGDEASHAQMSVANWRTQARKATAGSGMSKEEKALLDEAIEGAGTVDAAKTAIANTLEGIEATRANIMSGESPEAQQLYREQNEAQAPTQSAAPIPSFRPGGK